MNKFALLVITLLSTIKVCHGRQQRIHYHSSYFGLEKLTSRRKLRSILVIQKGCSKGCEECNQYNGCTKCRRGMFLKMEDYGTVTKAVCEHKCPIGFYGDKSPSVAICRQCMVSNCHRCFEGNYCTICNKGYFLHRGRCESVCPSGLFQNEMAGKCETAVDCVVSSWSEFSSCKPRRKKALTCKWGKKKRSRTILQGPSPGGKSCPKLKRTKKCRVSKSLCLPVNNLWVREELDKIQKLKKRKERKSRRGKKRKPIKISNNGVLIKSRKRRMGNSTS